ncbi:hypothetical protein SUNI508_11428 [Seiridium unicorne]|uniref:Uncharacterized protein n=1 Tax=Seiridium unicorne TaxID=138068 RepID=A0ABR2UHP1_9PEZI
MERAVIPRWFLMKDGGKLKGGNIVRRGFVACRALWMHLKLFLGSCGARAAPRKVRDADVNAHMQLVAPGTAGRSSLTVSRQRPPVQQTLDLWGEAQRSLKHDHLQACTRPAPLHSITITSRKVTLPEMGILRFQISLS